MIEYLLPTEGGDRGGQRERELPKAGLVAIEPQRDFLQKEVNGGLALRRDLRNRGFDVDDVGGSMVYRGALTGDGRPIFWVPYSRWWSHTYPIGYQVYYVPLTLVNEPTPEERAAARRAAEAARKEQAETERLRRELLANLDDLRDDDSGLLHRFFSRALYGETPYGRPVSGTEDSTLALDLDGAHAWHRHHIVAGNMIAGAAGSISQTEVESLLRRHFSQVPAGPRRDEVIPSPPKRTGRRVLIVDKPERTQSQILVGQLAPH